MKALNPTGTPFGKQSKMSLRLQSYLAFAAAILATCIGCSQTLLYKIPPILPTLLWFPLGFLGEKDTFLWVILSLIQFPLFATVYAWGIRRWPPGSLIFSLVLAYLTLLASALIFYRSPV